MWLSSIIRDLQFERLQGSLEINIHALALDSRKVVRGSLFVAINGFETDGHRYAAQAIERGAVAIVVEKEIEINDPAITILKVKDSRDTLARLSAEFYGHPTEDLNVIGVTGTNGKTSITYFLRSIIEQANRKTGLIGTMGTSIDGVSVPSMNTTPESLQLQELFATMRDAGIEDCIMEVSSHALAMKRTAYSRFNTAIFTNLTPDHLEYHQSMDDYYEAKSSLFNVSTHANIVNADDYYGRRLISKLQEQRQQVPLVTYGIYHPSDVYATHIHYFEKGTSFHVHTPAGHITIWIHLPGEIYVYNALAAIAAAICNGISLNVIQAGLYSVKGVRGRLETVYQDEDNKIIVDFAHTEDGLEKALRTIRPFASSRVILVFGVYGDEGIHGKRKRQAMGKVAGMHADLSIVTTDNPKHQDPQASIHEIMEGIQQVDGICHAFVDRRHAIEFALRQCKRGDTVLIAGKGHETTQRIGDVELPFSEKDIVTAFMAARNIKGEKQLTF